MKQKKYYKFFYIDKKINDEFTLSIIMNFHMEEEIAKNTLKNIFDALKYHNNAPMWFKIEVIIVLDNSDTQTEKEILKHRTKFDKILKTEFGDPSSARNYGAEYSTCSFILFADGDDLVSKHALNALFVAVYNHYCDKLLKNKLSLSDLSCNEHAIIFPRALIEFPVLRMQIYSPSNNNITYNNAFDHLYISKLLIFRKLHEEKLKFRESHLPYGFEDWDFNNRALALGVKFLLADYSFYYRKKKKGISILQNSLKSNAVVHNSPLYKKIMEKFDENPQKKEEDHYATDLLTKNDHIDFLKKYNEEIESYTEFNINNFDFFSNNLSYSVKTYIKLSNFLGDKEIILFSPWIILGGADKLTIEHANILKKNNYKSGLITTISPGERISKIEIPTFDMIENCEGWDKFSIQRQTDIFLKALVNSQVKLIHVINSEIVLILIKNYKQVLENCGIKLLFHFFVLITIGKRMNFMAFRLCIRKF